MANHPCDHDSVLYFNVYVWPKLELEAESTCDGLLVTVTADDEPVGGASVSVRRLSDAQLIASGNTVEEDPKAESDSAREPGTILFTGFCDYRVDIKATMSGYTKSDIETIQLASCSECMVAPVSGDVDVLPPGQCEDYWDCGDPNYVFTHIYRCVDGFCEIIPCCGVVANYTCYGVEECRITERCEDNECVPIVTGEYLEPLVECTSSFDCADEEDCVDGDCIALVCDECRLPLNHTCQLYYLNGSLIRECCPGTTECPEGNSCVNYRFIPLGQPELSIPGDLVLQAAVGGLVLLSAVSAYWIFIKR